jgi:hypothetical protein
MCGCVVAQLLPLLDVAPASPFIASKERAWVTFVVRGENERETKMWPQAWPSFFLSGGNSFPVAQRCNKRCSFGLSVCWCCVLWPCFVLCAYVLLRTGDTGALICVERGLGGIVVVTPVAIEVWMSSWWNDRGHIGSGRGSYALVNCARSRPSHRQERVPRLGVPVAHRLARGFHVTLGRGGSKLRGLGALMTSRWLGRGRKKSAEAPISPETSPQGSGGMEFVVRATSD